MYRKKLTWGAGVLAILLLSGCTGEPMPNSLNRSGGLNRPAPGKGLLYVYRDSTFVGAGAIYDVHAERGGKDINLGTLGAGSVLYRNLAPGKYRIWAKTEAESSLPLTLRRGETVCVEGKVGMGFFVGHPYLQRVDPSTCRQKIRELVQGEKKQQKSK